LNPRAARRAKGSGRIQSGGVAQRIGLVTLIVADYDEAIGYFVQRLGFQLLEDTPLALEKRWVRVAPQGSAFSLLLAKAATPDQALTIGKQAGGRVFLFLHTDDFDADHAAMMARGVRFIEAPRHESYGKVCVFEDLCGNRWDLIERL
jgi:catechol 2,3-dioxygenase-like lactoylglutathione lyase family enzyme